MKNIFKTITVLFAAILLFSCDENTIFEGDPGIELTPVYSITLLNNNGPFKINIYKEKAILLEYANEEKVTKYSTTNFVDNSTETTYDVTFTQLIPEDQGDGTIVNQEVSYDLDGDKTAGTGTLVINNGIDPAVTHAGIAITEEEIYN